MTEELLTEDVRLTYETGHVAVITMDHSPRNTLSWRSRKALVAILDELSQNVAVRCVVLTGANGTFTAGANLREDQSMTNGELVDFVSDFDRILDGIENFRAPVIGAITGPAIGGGLEVALACDIRVASTDAFFVAAGVNVGLIANFWRLVRVCGLGPAKEILYTGDRYSAEQLLRWGLVTELHPPDRTLDAALDKARRIASRAPLSVEATKACVNLSPGLDRDTARAIQVEQFVKMFNTDDHSEALRAFFERRDGDYARR